MKKIVISAKSRLVKSYCQHARPKHSPPEAESSGLLQPTGRGDDYDTIAYFPKIKEIT